MGTTRKLIIVAVLSAVGFGLTACDMEFTGSPVIDSQAAAVVYKQQAHDQAAFLLVNTMNKYFQKVTATTFARTNDSVRADFDLSDVPDSHTSGLMFADLGFDATANMLMDNTNGNMGMQTATSPNYNATWTYSAKTGLDLTIAMNRSN